MDFAQLLAQLGGSRFVAMTGAKNFLTEGPNTLRFNLPSRFATDGINLVRITLNPTDTYRVEFMRVRNLEVKMIDLYESLFVEDLRRTFTQVTGLDCTL